MGFFSKNTAESTIKVGYNGNAATRGLKKLDAGLKNAKKSFRETKGSMGLMAAGLVALTLVAVKAKQALDFTVESVVKFEAASARLKAILKPTTEQFAALEKQALELGKTTVFTASQVVEAFTEMGKLGLKTNEILAAGNDVLALAALAQVDMATAATITAQTLNQFQLEAGEAGRIVDVIAKSFTSSALDITKFSEAMKFIGPLAGTTGEEVETVTAALAVLADNALDSSLAGTAMRKMLLELANTNSKASKRIRETGKEAKTLTDKLKILKEMQIGVTEAAELFGLRAATGAIIVINNADAVEELAIQFENAEGAAQDMAETMLDSVEGATIRLKSAQEALALSIKDELLPVLRSMKEFWIDFTLNLEKALPMFIKMQRVMFTSLTIEDVRTDRLLKQAEILGDETILLSEQKKMLGEIKGINNEIAEIRERDENNIFRANINEAKINELVKKRVKIREQEQKIANAIFEGRVVQGEPSPGADKAAPLPKSTGKTKGVKDTFPVFEGFQAGQKEREKLFSEARKKWNKTLDDSLKEGEKQQNEYIERRIAAKREFDNLTLTDTQIRLNDELAQIEFWNKKKAFADGEYEALKSDIAKRGAEERIAIKEKEERDKLNMALGGLSSLSTISNAVLSMMEEGDEKRKAFARIQQGIAIGEATINAIKMGIGAGADAPGGPITRGLAVAAALAMGMAQVAAIQAQEFQTGGIGIGGISRSRQRDTIPAMIGGGESVISAPQTAQHQETLQAIQNNTANTANGLRSMGAITNNFFGVSTEQILSVSIDVKRQNLIGRRL